MFPLVDALLALVNRWHAPVQVAETSYPKPTYLIPLLSHGTIHMTQ